ncbi:MAG: hypothetical protein EXQ53_05715 [Acidobacteria bacterium]|nr:hypothetical protein [Acidobacteriota bacterium]
MDVLAVSAPMRGKLGDAGSDGLVMMFAEAHRNGEERLDRRIAEVSASFDRRLAEEISKFRVEMVEKMSDLRFDLLKWNFLFWVGQLAAITAILSVMLRDLR